ncbi:MAG: 5-formyltetrahydrofolate cyclo-ligase [Lachnospiraceae bacterium]|nr:5-formyltetrahydrofolate cyclo-ligase [Lachnospiraceae bacterium]
MSDETIKRINELYHLSKTRPLTEDELKEQGLLRAEYLSAIRASVKGQLSNVSIVEKNGDIHPLESLKEQKTKLRKACLDRRREIEKERFEEAAGNLKKALILLIREKGIENVLLYASKEGEIPTDPLFEAIKEAKNSEEKSKAPCIFYPRVTFDTMEFIFVDSTEELKPGNFGVREPMQGKKFTPDCKNVLILLPGLSFDREGHRIGYGKGYYDAFLSGFPKETDYFTVGACMKECMAENFTWLVDGKIPCEKHDKKADLIIVV